MTARSVSGVQRGRIRPGRGRRGEPERHGDHHGQSRQPGHASLGARTSLRSTIVPPARSVLEPLNVRNRGAKHGFCGHGDAPRLPPCPRSWLAAGSCGYGRRPQPGDCRRDLHEHLSRHRDLGHLERDVRPWLTTLAPILINFSRGLVSDHGSAALGIANVRMKLPRLYASAWS